MTRPAYSILDADTHLTEPADLWTSRVPSRWRDRVPVVRWDEAAQEEAWFLDGEKLFSVGITAVAGWPEPYPAHPRRYADVHPGAYDARARLRYMDELGIWAQVLYPNVGGFGSQAFLRIDEPERRLACVRAYNDFLIEWVSVDPRRFVAVLATPFWDVAAAVREIERCAALGHRGVLFTGEPHGFGLPVLGDRHWDPLWAAAQAAGLPVSFHIGSGADMREDFTPERMRVDGHATTAARAGSRLFLANGSHVLDLLFSGVLARFPQLQFVSVESGAGWLPFVLQAADYQFETLSVRRERPELELQPSEYFRRQVYACCWFERVASDALLEFVGAERILFETDFPHPTCLYAEEVPRAIAAGMAGLSEDVRRRILWGNAAQLYRIEGP